MSLEAFGESERANVSVNWLMTYAIVSSDDSGMTARYAIAREEASGVTVANPNSTRAQEAAREFTPGRFARTPTSPWEFKEPKVMAVCSCLNSDITGTISVSKFGDVRQNSASSQIPLRLMHLAELPFLPFRPLPAPSWSEKRQVPADAGLHDGADDASVGTMDLTFTITRQNYENKPLTPKAIEDLFMSISRDVTTPGMSTMARMRAEAHASLWTADGNWRIDHTRGMVASARLGCEIAGRRFYMESFDGADPSSAKSVRFHIKLDLLDDNGQIVEQSTRTNEMASFEKFKFERSKPWTRDERDKQLKFLSSRSVVRAVFSVLKQYHPRFGDDVFIKAMREKDPALAQEVFEQWRTFCRIARQTSRSWSDTTGNFKVDAFLIEVVDKTVSLRRADNQQVVRVPLSRLSDIDREFAESFGYSLNP